ncbi:MAG: hypothetical protein LBQ44_05055 [Treponema sp.]|jgi:hypothetical protein|nr:hypothetical protein [Treponema sp.]
MAYVDNPAEDADFDLWFEHLVRQVMEKTSGKRPTWPHVPQNAVTDLLNAFAVWHTAYEKTLGPAAGVDLKAKNAARRAAERIIPLWHRGPRWLRIRRQDPVPARSGGILPGGFLEEGWFREGEIDFPAVELLDDLTNAVIG